MFHKLLWLDGLSRGFCGGGEASALSGLGRSLRVAGGNQLPDGGALAVAGIDYRADFAGQIDWDCALCHMFRHLMGNRRHEDYGGRRCARY